MDGNLRESKGINLNAMVESAKRETEERLAFSSLIESKSLSGKKQKIYMAGKLFNEADRSQREKEYAKLKEVNERYGVDKEIFSPMFSSVNDKSKLPSSLDIFNADEKELMESDVIFADLSDGDIGVAMELGMVIYEDVKIYAYISDIRIPSAGEYSGVHVPYGYNQFVIGGLEKYFKKVYLGFEEALAAYIEDHR